jgi:MraZ protein
MFLGSYRPSFDAKTRRFALPKKIRLELENDEVVLSFGFDACVFGFDPNSWEAEAKKRLDEPITSKSARNTRRFLFSSAQYLVLDNQGRFILPDDLCKFAKIIKPVVIGAGDHFEIWDDHVWMREKKKLEEVVL